MQPDLSAADKARLAQLIDQLRDQENTGAAEALSALRQRGWLTDGTLAKATLYNSNFRGADLQNVNFAGAVLSGSDFRDANLRHANLANTNLIDTKLGGAILHDADLSNADLIASDLTGADLRNASLYGAALGGTTLNYTRFQNTDLREADFNNAHCDQTIFADVDLSQTTGLAAVRHFGPSTIGVGTLFRSKGKISIVFLRGCGLPETLIDTLQTVVDQPGTYYTCYICYSRVDIGFARQLYQALQERGIRCWFDEYRLKLGNQRARRVREADTVILCASETSLKSRWAGSVVELALARETSASYPAPVLLAMTLDAYLSGDEFDDAHATAIRDHVIADFNGWQHDRTLFDRQVETVIEALRVKRERS